MIITYHTHNFIKITQGSKSIAINPPGGKFAQGLSKSGTDIVLLSNHLPENSGIDLVTYNGSEPFVVDGPGEYEVGDLYIKGFLTKTEQNRDYVNTFYIIHFDDMNIAVSGHIESKDCLSSEAQDALSEIHVLIQIIGGREEVNPHDAWSFAKSLEPHIIIPVGGDKKDLETFIKEGGNNFETVEKITIKRKEAEAKSSAIIVISA